MKILSAAEMQTCDAATIERPGVSSLALMQAAAKAVAVFARLQFPAAKRFTVLCGRGNNGGDGLYAALLLAEAGGHVTVLLLGAASGLREEPAAAWKMLASRTEHVTCHALLTEEALAGQTDALAADLILDAVVGTGFRGALRGLPLAAIEWLKRTNAPVLAVDLPSGWNADSTAASAGAELVFPADAVVTFTAPKPSHVFGQLTRRWDQPIVVASIGSPDEVILSSLNLHWAGSAKAITEDLRPADSNKGMFGHVLVIGGSPGKSGAPAMASLAALRAGAGLVTAAVVPSVLPLVAAITPELMTQALATSPTGEISSDNLTPVNLRALLHRITVLALGPGLGTSPEATEFALGLLSQSRLPAVVDADALNAISTRPHLLRKIAEGRTLVLTPHPGEMSRLSGLPIAEIQANRLEVAREFAIGNQVTLVLKGWRTLIAHPDGSVAINTSGNPGMAKGGSGDLLTGIIAGLLAQFPANPKQAVEAAVYLHGLAADFALCEQDQHTLLATDLLAFLPQAFRYLPQAKSGYCWVQGLPAETLTAAAVREVSHE